MKQNMKQRILALCLALCLLVGLMPTGAWAADVVASGTCGENLTWELDDEGLLTISGTGDMTDYGWGNSPWYYDGSIISVVIEEGVTSIGKCAFYGCSSLTGITIPEGVTSIGESTFGGCSSLKSITIPESVTSIGGYAFSGCFSLATVNIPESVTSIGDFTFSHCTSLPSVTIPESVTSIGIYAFCECSSLTSVIIGSGVTSIGSAAFSLCTSLPSVTIPESVTDIGSDVFLGCSSLTGIWVDENNPNYSSDDRGVLFDKERIELIQPPGALEGAYSVPEGVTSIGRYAFYDCTSLTSITIPESVTSIGRYAFCGCSSLISITISESVTSIGDYAFSDCSSLTTVNIPEGVTSIGHYTFYFCTSLPSITIPESVTGIGDSAFSGCAGLTGIWVDENNPNYSSDSYGILFNKDKTELIRAPGALTGAYAIPDSVLFIEDQAFSGCSDLTDLSVLGNVISIGRNVFHNCTNLHQIYFHGDAPEIDDSFGDLIATAYYPENNPTWTADVMQNYGGTITWVPYTPNPFTDVPADKYYHDPVLWAYENGITAGATATTFNPDGDCTRGQIVTFLWRAAGCPDPTTTNNPFTDVDSDDYFYKAVLWAVEEGITSGATATTFNPKGSCTRSQVVTFMYRAAGEPAPESQNNPFVDISPDKYYYDAVLWAVENGITSGMSAAKFGPNNTCTRGQIVTFLYRGYAE